MTFDEKRWAYDLQRYEMALAKLRRIEARFPQCKNILIDLRLASERGEADYNL